MPHFIDDTQRLTFLARAFKDFRFIGYPSMDGATPCWSCHTPAEGRTTRKTLREAIDAAMAVADLPDPAAAQASFAASIYAPCDEPLPFALQRQLVPRRPQMETHPQSPPHLIPHP